MKERDNLRKRWREIERKKERDQPANIAEQTAMRWLVLSWLTKKETEREIERKKERGRKERDRKRDC